MEADGESAEEVVGQLTPILERLIYPGQPIKLAEQAVQKLKAWLCREKKQ